MNKYGKRLRELREQHEYTQEELARLLNTSRSRIGMYEQGKRQPDFEMQEAIADLFNVTIDYLFGRKESDHDKELIDLFEKADPGIQNAVMLLLRSAPHDS